MVLARNCGLQRAFNRHIFDVASSRGANGSDFHTPAGVAEPGVPPQEKRLLGDREYPA